jgi:hypothetical protein
MTDQSQLIALSNILSDMHQGAWLYLYAATGRQTLPENWPQAERESTQRDLDHISGGSLLTLVFAVFEDYWPEDTRSLESQGSQLVDEWDLQWLLAFRHVRHSFAHKPAGGRARIHADVFDQVMEGQRPLLGVVECGPDMLYVKQSIGQDALFHIKHVTEKAINYRPDLRPLSSA